MQKWVCDQCGTVFHSTHDELACPNCGAVSLPLSAIGLERDTTGQEDWRDPEEWADGSDDGPWVDNDGA
jgi:uncharacterized Zn finger protein (UPF0148 family)